MGFAITGAGLRAFQAGLSALALLAFSATCALAQAGDVATVAAGQLRGAAAESVVSYKGIPYAAPPVGDLRWRAPQPAQAWSGVRNATAFGPDCMQRRVSWDPTQSTGPMSEDCLTLNVWRPANVEAGAPVMVWIHGGGFVMGSGSQAIFDGASLARRGVVVVTFNYRLGRFGFFAHPAFGAEQAGQARGNYAFLDQIAALQWVQGNIATFGGDPANVTVFGESAGGGSVLQLMLAQQARGLFHRAIVESGGGRDDLPRIDAPNGERPAAEAIGVAFATRAGAANADAAALRAISAERVMGRLDLLNNEEATYSGPMIDGVLVTSNASDGFEAGRQAHVPLIIGANSNELGFIPAFFRGAMNQRLARRLGDDRETVQAAFGSAWDERFASDFSFVEPARHIANVANAHGQPVYFYNFGYVPESKRRQQNGAPHASDIAFVFDTLAATDAQPTAGDHAAARLVSDYWIAFARSGDPNGDGRPQWAGYQRNGAVFKFTNEGATSGQLDAGPLNALEAHHAD